MRLNLVLHIEVDVFDAQAHQAGAIALLALDGSSMGDDAFAAEATKTTEAALSILVGRWPHMDVLAERLASHGVRVVGSSNWASETRPPLVR